jgi:uncharacterized membrane protein YfcA
MDLILIGLLILIGTISGTLISSIGIGAGLFIIPCLILLGIPLKQGVIIVLILQLLPQTIPAVYNFWKEESITYELIYISIFLLIGNIIGSYYGSMLHTKNIINEKYLYISLVMFLLFAAAFISCNHILN